MSAAPALALGPSLGLGERTLLGLDDLEEVRVLFEGRNSPAKLSDLV